MGGRPSFYKTFVLIVINYKTNFLEHWDLFLKIKFIVGSGIFLLISAFVRQETGGWWQILGRSGLHDDFQASYG